MKQDLLNMEFINSLPQPLWIRQWGDEDFHWPLYDICVEIGLLRIDVCGMLDVLHIGDIAEFRDDVGKTYEADEFYLEVEE